MSALDAVVQALTDQGHGPRQSGGSWTARCPGHDDRSPSLSLRGIEGSVLLHCFAGCEPADILAPLGLTLADLYDNRGGTQYAYADGRIVHRTPDKRFRQSGVRNGTGVLYRLDRVRQAVAAGQPVYLCEGEKDVHAMESLGVVATTSPMGATNWHKVDPKPLAGATVVIVADKDKAGLAYAAQAKAGLDELGCRTTVVQAAAGKDAADHIAAGFSLEQFIAADHLPTGRRELRLTPASTIKPRPVFWLWHQRFALGSLGLLAGREGLGKSTLAYWIAAQVTRGVLPGEHRGHPRSVIVGATEDSWEHTIVPRLMAADADLDRVFRVDVHTSDDVLTGLVLPRDVHGLERAIAAHDVVLVLLDPLSSRLAEDLDSHRDPEVRRALEPLATIADRTRCFILGLAHHNKSGSNDALTLVLGSRAFTAVARSVSTVVKDPDDDSDSIRLFGTPKNNLGPDDLPAIRYRIVGQFVTTDEGPASTATVDWLGDSDRSIGQAIAEAAQTAEDRSATTEAADWLTDYLVTEGGRAASADIKRDGAKAGHTHDSLKRARRRLGLGLESLGFPRVTYWHTPPVGPQSEQQVRGDSPTALTTPTGAQSAQSGQSEQLGHPPRGCPDSGWPLDSEGHAIRCAADRDGKGDVTGPRADSVTRASGYEPPPDVLLPYIADHEPGAHDKPQAVPSLQQIAAARQAALIAQRSKRVRELLEQQRLAAEQTDQ